MERKSKLDEALKLFMLNREVDDLEQWIAEREVVAGSHELGQDYDHVTVSIFFFFGGGEEIGTTIEYLNVIFFFFKDVLLS